MTERVQLPYRVQIPQAPYLKEVYEEWLRANCQGLFEMVSDWKYDYVLFADDNDAVMYKLSVPRDALMLDGFKRWENA